MLHQNVVDIISLTVRNENGVIVNLVVGNAYETDDYYELLKINFDQPIKAGIYTIQIEYLGKINENPLDRGFYQGYYYVDGVKQWVLKLF